MTRLRDTEDESLDEAKDRMAREATDGYRLVAHRATVRDGEAVGSTTVVHLTRARALGRSSRFPHRAGGDDSRGAARVRLLRPLASSRRGADGERAGVALRAVFRPHWWLEVDAVLDDSVSW